MFISTVLPLFYSSVPFQQQIEAQSFSPDSFSNTDGIVSTSTNNSRLPYSNSIYGFDVKYPSDWSYTEYDAATNDSLYPIVDFVPPISADPNLKTNLQIGIQDLDITRLPSLDQYTRESVNAYRNSLSNFSLISVRTNTTVSGLPAYEIVFMDNSEGLDRKSIDVGVIDEVNARAYYLVLNSEYTTYDQFFPFVQDMFDSFQLSSLPEETNISSSFQLGRGTTSDSSEIRYTSPLSNFNFEYPSNWENQESLTLMAPKSGNLDMTSEVINIQTERLPGDITLAEYTDSGINQLTSLQHQNFRISDSSPTMLAGLPAHNLTHSFTEDGINKEIRQIWAIDTSTDTAYVITYGSTVNEFNEGLPALQTIIDSFQFNGVSDGKNIKIEEVQ
jgi:hypothetical protein